MRDCSPCGPARQHGLVNRITRVHDPCLLKEPPAPRVSGLRPAVRFTSFCYTFQEKILVALDGLGILTQKKERRSGSLPSPHLV